MAPISCLIMAAIIYMVLAEDAAPGPWVNYDRIHETLHLPRERLELPKGEIVGWELLYGRSSSNRYNSELNVISRSSSGVLAKHPLVGGQGLHGLDALLAELETETGIIPIANGEGAEGKSHEC